MKFYIKDFFGKCAVLGIEWYLRTYNNRKTTTVNILHDK